MTVETLAHADSLEQLAACEDYSRFLAEQEELDRHRMEIEFAECDHGEPFASLADQLGH